MLSDVNDIHLRLPSYVWNHAISVWRHFHRYAWPRLNDLDVAYGTDLW
jgi:hypothetical protein